jgi:aldehyde dehydrogenase (NAD+)
MKKIVALIPSRSGSKRIPNKNIKILNGHPLIAYSIVSANDSPYGLTGCIHTRSFDRANHFIQHLQAGVAVVNAGTYGSEPHMPFGGSGYSGNGTREPGTEALDIYSELKDVYVNINPNEL